MAAMDVNDDPPTHVLVQQQLEDVVRTQQIALDKLKLSVCIVRTVYIVECVAYNSQTQSQMRRL